MLRTLGKISIGALVAVVASFSFAKPETLTVLTHDSWGMDKTLIAKFEKANNASVKFVKGGDAVQVVNKAILTKRAPIADVIYGFDNSLLSKVLGEGLLQPSGIKSGNLFVSGTAQDLSGYAIPVDYGYIALNYDKEFFKSVALPTSFSDLAKPEFAKLVVTENPATSSPGLGFLLATVAAFGEDGYLEFWQSARENGIKVTNGWTDAYYTDFSLAKGDRPIVVSYGSSPAAELFYSEAKPALTEPPTGNLFFDKSSFFQVEFAGILKGSKKVALAKKFLKWVTSKPVQEAIPTSMWVYPALKSAKLPDIFEFAEVPKNGAKLAPKVIAANETRWIAEWTKVVLQGQSAAEVKSLRK